MRLHQRTPIEGADDGGSTHEAHFGNWVSAADAGQLSALSKLLASDPQLLDACDSMGLTALHTASRSGHCSCVKWLLRQGANVNVLTMNGETALHMAVISDNASMVKALIHYGCDKALRDHSSATARDRASPRLRAVLDTERAFERHRATTRRSSVEEVAFQIEQLGSPEPSPRPQEEVLQLRRRTWLGLSCRSRFQI